MATIVSVWTDLECAGGTVLGVVDGARVEITEQVGSPSRARVTAPAVALRDAQAAAGRVLRIDDTQRGLSEWILTSDAQTSAGGTATAVGGTVRELLARRGLCRSVRVGQSPLYAFDLGPQTVTALLDALVLPNRAADGLAWLGVGTVEYAGVVDLGTITRQTRGQVLDAIERATGLEVRLRRAGATGYVIDVLRQIGREAPLQPLRVGTGADVVDQERDLPQSCGAVLPFGDSGTPLGETAWRIQQVIGSGPWWIVLVDPAGGDPPILEDGQFVGARIRLASGQRLAIDASRASDSAVRVASLGGATAGVLVGLVADDTDTPLDRIASPSALAGPVGATTAMAMVRGGASARNYLVNADLSQGITGFERRGTVAVPVDVWGRDDAKLLEGTVQSTVGAGGTSVTVQGLPAQALIRLGDVLRVRGWAATVSADVVVSSTGTATLPIGSLPANVVDNQPVTLVTPTGVRYALRADGAQTAGAANLAVKDLPPSVALATGDTLDIATGTPTVLTLSNANEVSPDIWQYDVVGGDGVTLTGSTVTLTEVWEAYSPFLRTLVEVFTYSVPVVGTYTGGATIQLDFTGVARVIPDAGQPGVYTDFTLVSATFSAVGTQVDRYTVTGTPPLWGTNRRAVASITPTVAATIPAGATVTWRRSGGASVGILTVPIGGAVSAGSLTLETLQASIVPVNASIQNPSEDVIANATVQASAGGVATVPLVSATTTTLTAGAAVRIPRCPAFAQPLGPVLLRVRSDVGAAAPIYNSATQRHIRSGVVRVPVPTGASVTVRGIAWITTWALVAGSAINCNVAVEDVDAQVVLADAFLGVGAGPTIPMDGDQGVPQHHRVACSEALTQSRNLRWRFQSGDTVTPNREFLWLRAAMLTVSADADVPFTPGALDNLMHQRANRVLQARRRGTRYRVRGRELARWVDAVGIEALTLGGSARLIAPTLGVDDTVRIVGMTYTLGTDDLTMELGTLFPRLTDVEVSS